jgi:Family of unknown function (DUF6411)
MFVYPSRFVKGNVGLRRAPWGNPVTTMLAAAIIAFCVILFVLAFLAPRLSRYFQRAGDKPLQVGQRTTGKAPGKLGKWLQKPFSTSRKAVQKSGSKGREERSKTSL